MSMMVNPFVFGGGAAASQAYASRTALRTTTGTQDLTVPGVTDTPVAVIVEMVSLTADGFGTSGNSGCQGFATTTSDQFVVSKRVGGDPKDHTQANKIIALHAASGTAYQAEAAITAFIPGGVTINVTTAPGSAYLVTLQVFCAANGYSAAKIGTGNSTAGSSQTHTPSIRADVLLFNVNPPGGSAGNYAAHYQGMACYNGSTIYQATVSTFGNTPGGTSNIVGAIRSGACLQDAGAAGNYLTVTSITSTQFTVVSTGMGAGYNYLALQRTNNANAWCGVVDSPTSTGAQTIGSVGFTPTSAMILPSFETTTNRRTDDGTIGGQGRIAIDRGSAFEHIYCTRDNVPGGTNAGRGGSISGKLQLYTHDGTASFDSTVTGLVSGGIAVNVAATPGAQKMCLMLLG